MYFLNKRIYISALYRRHKCAVQVKEERVDTLYFDNQAFIDLWKTTIEKIKSSSSSTTNGQRIAETSERAKMQKRQKCRKKKERKKEREKEEEEEEEEEMEMQAHGLPASHRG